MFPQVVTFAISVTDKTASQALKWCEVLYTKNAATIQVRLDLSKFSRPKFDRELAGQKRFASVHIMR